MLALLQGLADASAAACARLQRQHDAAVAHWAVDKSGLQDAVEEAERIAAEAVSDRDAIKESMQT